MRFHGGSFWVKGRVIDFSVNLNPLGIPKVIEEEIKSSILYGRVYENYPDYNYSELKKAITYFYDIEREQVIPTNGASEALNLAILAIQPKSLVIISPSYGDYELLCNALKIKCIYVLMEDADSEFKLNYDNLLNQIHGLEDYVVIITNPNNPTGTIIENELITDLACEIGKKSTYIILDEAYAELSDYTSMLELNPPSNVIVVRSFTKTFNVPGLRLGFLYTTSNTILIKIDEIRPTWNVNAIADYVFRKALVEYKKQLWEFISRSREYVAKEKKYLVKKLKSLGFHVYSSKTNFTLLKHEWISSHQLQKILLNRYRILIRPAHTFRGLSIYHSRISVRKRHENELLVKALEEAIK